MTSKTMIQIELSIWHRNHQILIESRENATELLNEYIAIKGIESKRDKYIAEMYEKEIREINSLLQYSSDHDGVPF